MSLTVVSTPDKLLKSVIQSNVNAAISQLPYAFKREDLVSGNVDSDSGAVRIVVTGVAAEGVVVGDSVYWTGVDGVYPTQVYVVFAVATDALTLTWSHISDQVNVGYVNLLTTRSDYAVEIQIEKTDDSEVLPSVFFYKPSQSGELFIDIGNIIVTEIENDLVAHLNYRILYRENYTGINLAFTNDVTILALLGEKGIGQLGGSNQWELLLKQRAQFQKTSAQQGLTLGEVEIVIEEDYDGTDLTGVDVTSRFQVGDRVTLSQFGVEPAYNGIWIIQAKRFAVGFSQFIIQGAVYTINDGVGGKTTLYDRGMFLTHFTRLRFYEGWAVGLSMVIDSNYATRNGASGMLTLRERARDINNNQVGASVDITIGTSTARIREHIMSGQGLEADTPIIAFFLFNNANETVAQIDADRVEDCPNPIMLTWINSLGASEYYQFQILQEVDYGATEGLTFESAVDVDIENITRQKTRLSSDQTLKLTLFTDNIQESDIRALHEIKTSEFVNVFLSQDGTLKVGVTVVDNLSTGYTRKGINNGGEFTITIEFPEDYNFFDIKE